MQIIKDNIAALILGISIIIFGILLSVSINNIGDKNNTINVTGSASKIITSDYGVLRFEIETSDINPKNAFAQMQKNVTETIKFIKDEGIDQNSIEQQTIQSYTTYADNTNKELKYFYLQPIQIKLNDLDKIQKLAGKITSLIDKGIYIRINPPQFFYSKLQEIKSEVQAEATKDAINRAQKILSSTNNTLGAIKSVRTGVLQITPPYSNAISDYGMNDETSIEKKVTAVVNITFSIK